MKVLTLEEWLEKFGDDCPCLMAPSKPDRKNCFCKNCKQARQDYQAAVAQDQKLIEEYERLKNKKQSGATP